MKRLIFLSISAIPLVWQLPYLFTAWRGSRLDQWDWIFYILTVPAVLLGCRKVKPGNFEWSALTLLIPALAAALLTPYHKVNALSVAGGCVVIFAAVWLIYSWQFACRILPAAVILLSGTPSSSYAVSLLLMCPVYMAWAVKFLLAAGCFVWIICNERFLLQIRKGTLCFIAALGCSGFLLLHSREIYFEGKEFIPEFTGHVGEFWGRSIEPDENTKRFFVTGIVRQFRYNRNDTDVSVLAVKCGKDIHEIHPASHCLRTGFWTINSEKIFYLQDDFAVTEIDAEKGSSRFLMWVWYSGDEISTPGFLGFRRHFKSGGNYYTYQISTPIHKDSEQSRAVLRQFLRSLKNRSDSGMREVEP